MKVAGILWNSMNSFEEMAITDLQSYFNIEEIIKLDLGEDLENFIWNIYGRANSIVEEHVKIKIDSIVNQYNSSQIVVVFMNLPEEKYTVDYIKSAKQNIRKKYSELVKKYRFDNVLHLTENTDEYKKVLYAIKKSQKVKQKNLSV